MHARGRDEQACARADEKRRALHRRPRIEAARRPRHPAPQSPARPRSPAASNCRTCRFACHPAESGIPPAQPGKIRHPLATTGPSLGGSRQSPASPPAQPGNLGHPLGRTRQNPARPPTRRPQPAQRPGEPQHTPAPPGRPRLDLAPLRQRPRHQEAVGSPDAGRAGVQPNRQGQATPGRATAYTGITVCRGHEQPA